MKKSRFSEAQIGRILQEVEMGAKAGETCRKHGISEPTYYKWKSQFSGMTVSRLTQLRQLQGENAKLKRMYADLALMHQPQAVGTDSPHSWLPAGQARPSGARCRGIMVAGEG